MHRFAIIGVVGLSLLVGCSPKASTTASTTTGVTPKAPGPQPGLSDPGRDAKLIQKQLEKATENIDPVAKGTEGWAASKARAEDLTKAAEAKIATLKNVGGGSTTKVRLDKTPGMSLSEVNIASANKFYIEFPNAQTEPEVNLQQEALVADGSFYAHNSVSSAGWSPKKPVAQLKAEGTASLSKWPLSFPRIIFSALQGGMPMTNVVREARSSGLDVLVEERTKKGVNRTAKQHRVLISRRPADEKKLGKLVMEMVFDDFFKLPVTIRTMSVPPKGPSATVAWTMSWAFEPPKPFDANRFVIKAPSAKATKT